MLTILILSIIAFGLYFHVIGLWYLGLIPFLIFLVFFIYYLGDISFKNKTSSLLQKYGLLIAWFFVQFGLFLILRFFGLDSIATSLSIILINIIFWIFSYMFKYQDGKMIGQTTYYLFSLGFLIYVRAIYGFLDFFVAFTHILSLTLAVVGFVVFVLSIFFETEKNLQYIFMLLLFLALGTFLFKQIANIYVFLSLLVVLLAVLYSYIYYVLSHKPPTETQVKEISVRRILAGERVLKNKVQATDWSKKVYSFIDGFPNFVKHSLEFANTFIILLLIYLYFQNTLTLHGNINQLFYWFVILGFVVNVYLLKKINYSSVIQRLLTFLVINFAIYLSLFSAFSGDIGSVVFLGIMRNILSSMMVFHIHKTKIGNYLIKLDYLFWLFTTMLALLVNIVLLFRTEISGQLLFPLILLYVGVQGIMFYYSIRYINKIKEIGEVEIDFTG